MLLLLFAQLAAPAAAEVAPLPDIEIRAHVEARRVEIEQQGEARLELRVDPGVTEQVRVERSAPPGQRNYRNLVIDLTAAARIAAPANTAATAPATREPTGVPE